MSGAELARDPLAAELLPVLLHRIHNATQLLGTLHALVVETGDASWLERRATDLAETGESVESLGYLLAVLASACGADLLMERREARGLEILFEAAREALRRRGRDLRQPESVLPDLAPSAGGGWELPWALGAALVAGASAPVGEEPPRWRVDEFGTGWRFEIDAVPSDALRALAPLFTERLAGCELEFGEARFRSRLPASWLRPSGAGRAVEPPGPALGHAQ